MIKKVIKKEVRIQDGQNQDLKRMINKNKNRNLHGKTIKHIRIKIISRNKIVMNLNKNKKIVHSRNQQIIKVHGKVDLENKLAGDYQNNKINKLVLEMLSGNQRLIHKPKLKKKKKNLKKANS